MTTATTECTCTWQVLHFQNTRGEIHPQDFLAERDVDCSRHGDGVRARVTVVYPLWQHAVGWVACGAVILGCWAFVGGALGGVYLMARAAWRMWG